jgi:regulator of replication initiation timing
MDPKDQKIVKLEQQITQLTQALQVIGRKVEFLERENNRRKMEVNQISSHLRK